MNVAVATFCMGLTIRLSDAGLRYDKRSCFIPIIDSLHGSRRRDPRSLQPIVREHDQTLPLIVVLPTRTQQLFVPKNQRYGRDKLEDALDHNRHALRVHLLNGTSS